MGSTGFDAVDWYDQPRYYDIVFDEDTGIEADFLESVALVHGKSTGRLVLEPACGSGRLVAELARRGWSVTGFDLSEEMLAYARARLEREPLTERTAAPRLLRARLEDFDVEGSYDLAHCLVSTFKYVLDERGARGHLERVAAALAPGGVYVLGLHLTEYAFRGLDRERWVGEREGTRVVCNIQAWPADRRARRERVRSRLVVTEDGRTRRFETDWLFRTYDARELRALLASVPALEHVATYDFGYDLEEPRELDDEQLDVVLVLRKRLRRRRA